MKKLLVDTTVFISAYGSRSATERGICARRVLDYVESRKDEFIVCKSARTLRELSPPIRELDRFETVPYHWMDERWEDIEGTWGNIGSRWGNGQERELADAARDALPDKGKRPNVRRDRGILGDAVFAGCAFLLTEDEKDFDRLAPIAERCRLRVINLLKLDAAAAIKELSASCAGGSGLKR